MKKLSKKIDCLGVLHTNKIPMFLNKYTTKISGSFLSRNKLYYDSKPLDEISNMREELLSHLCLDKKINYVILDYASHFSAQSYYFLLSINTEGELIKNALACLQEDVNNIVALIENKNIQTKHYILPKVKLPINFRNIELDNKLEIYSYVKSFGKTSFYFITPGLGSIFIGPFFKAVWGNDYKHILYSRFKNNDKGKFDSSQILDAQLYLIDDNIGSGFTTQELMQLFKNKFLGISAVEYDWYLYDVISKGLSPYTKFNYQLYDKLSLINTRNHKFLDKIIEMLKNEPKNYYDFLKHNKFHNILTNDFVVLFKVGKGIAKKYLPKPLYKQSLNFSKQIVKIYKGV